MSWLLALCLAGALPAQDLFKLAGDQSGAGFGFAVDRIGDVDKDGWDDFVVGVPRFDGAGRDSGKVVVFSGKDGLPLFEVLGDSADDQLGWAVSGAGDFDKDGVPDFAVSAPFDDDKGTNSGSVRVLSGKDGRLIRRFDGKGAFEIFGISVDGGGDADNDGWLDLVVGAHGDDVNGPNSGSARVLSGKDGREIWQVSGDGAFDFFGHSVAWCGDVNKDGHDDFVVGAPDDDNAGPQAGMVRVFSGKDRRILRQLDGDAFDDFFGHWVDGAGDVDNDGTPDLLIGAPQFFRSRPGPGYVKVISGKNWKVIYRIAGTAAGDFFGEPVRGIGDADGDGHDDFAVGAHRSDVAGVDSGAAFVYSGKDGGALMSLPGPRAGAWFGYVIAGARRVNLDPAPDLIVGAPEDRPAALRGGGAHVVSGKALTFFTDRHTVPISTGGDQVMHLRAGAGHGGMIYIVLGSMRSTSTGIRIPPDVLFPLDHDAYMTFTLTGHGTLILNSLSTLDNNGDGTARFALPRGHPPSLAGTFMRHAYLLIDLAQLKVVFASNPAPLTLVK